MNVLSFLGFGKNRLGTVEWLERPPLSRKPSAPPCTAPLPAST